MQPPSTTRISLGFVAAFLLLAANAVMSYITLDSLVSATRLLTQTEQAIKLLSDLGSAATNADASHRNYVSTGDDRYLEPYQNAQTLVTAKLDDLARLVAEDAGQHGRLAALRSLIGKHFDGMGAAINARRGKNTAAATALIQSPQSKARPDDIRRAISEMQNREEIVLASRRAEADHNAYITKVTYAIATFMNICLFGGICFVVISDAILRRKSAEAAREANEKVERSLAEVQERNQEITFLSQMSSFLQTCATSEEASKAIARFGPLLFPSEAGVIYLFHASRNYVEQTAAWGSNDAQEDMFQPSECWALRRGRLHVVGEQDNAMVCAHVGRHGAALRPYVCAPMMAQGETLGLLYLQARPADGAVAPLSEAKQQLVTAVAEQIALALANLRLRETLRQQSVRDPLTGLYNRRFLEEALDRELARLERKNLPLSLIMIDVDHFKNFNDTFGHEAGDAVLRDLGSILQRIVRGGDIVCRFGGEEFTVIMPEANIEIGRQRAEILREATRELRLVHDGKSLGAVTLSLGVAAFPEHGRKRQHVLQAADAALYEAKNAGRNRVVVSNVSTLKIVENPQQRDQSGR